MSTPSSSSGDKSQGDWWELQTQSLDLIKITRQGNKYLKLSSLHLTVYCRPKVCVWSSLQFPWGKPLYRVASSDVKGTSASTGTKTKLDKYENKYDKQRSDCRVQRYEWIMAGPGRWCHGGAPHGWFSPLIIVFKYLYLPSPAQPSPAQPSPASPALPSSDLIYHNTIKCI